MSLLLFSMEESLLLLVGFVALVLLLAVSLFALLIYSGLFTDIDVKTSKPPVGKCFIAYKDGIGPYSGVGPSFSESTSIGPSLKQIGLYYDDPDVVAPEKLRWAVGAILAENDEPVDETIRAAYENEKYKFMTLPAVETSVNCIFPYATMISIFIAVKRVYPALSWYIKRHGLKVNAFLEVYFGGNIHFMAPITEGKEFFTLKALEAEEKSVEDSDASTAELAFPAAETESADEPAEGDKEVKEDDSEGSESSFEKVDASSL